MAIDKPAKPTKPTPRYVPTLTEVIRTADAKRADAKAAAAIDTELVVQQVMQRLLPKLESMIQSALRPVVQSQVDAFLEGWHQEVDGLVRHTVEVVLSEQKVLASSSKPLPE